ncbi:MAG: energy transducer TonB, partial [Proteobacteria bacterium]|nr:energy transducer TonB [Pseudomonadota bacterium]
YPAAARAAGLSGRATIQCSVTAAGGLSGCVVASEAPEGAGFGAATLAIADRFRISPPSANGRPVEGAVVRVPVLWRLGSDAPAAASPQPAPEESAAAAEPKAG